MSIRFQILATDGAARRGRLFTPHGIVETPAFMPVGTQATVKGLTPDQLAAAGVQVLLANTYHLAQRPGDAVVAEMGGLHRFMGWDRPILTDSGGFQVYSLAPTRRIDDDGAVFRSHIDGALMELTPERAVAIQENLGADVAMCLDECPPADAPAEYLDVAVRRTVLWAGRCRDAHSRTDQALFAIVQGGTDLSLRERCAGALRAMDFPGYALGGFSVGETPAQMAEALGPCAAMLPAENPRYLMGVGRPQDIVGAVRRGMDLFDCVLPTRNGRNASAFTAEGPLRLRNAVHKRDPRPLESGCPCDTCRGFSRAYLHHLFTAREMLGPVLLSLHNVAFYCRLLADIRQAVEERRLAELEVVCLARWEASS
jgi:queuine tRNA-ribosyltransferase